MSRLNGISRYSIAFVGALLAAIHVSPQTPKNAAPQAPAAKSAAQKPGTPAARPKLIVMIVVDQMRADYVDKFRYQWTGGLKRLVDQGAWFREAAYPYASTETCVGHATISTGAFPASHGMVANEWWDREQQKMVTCTADPNVKNMAYAGGSTKGGDSASAMLVPSYAEELKFQTGGGTRIVTFSLKARAAITLAGHKADVATWFDSSGSWVTSSPYGNMPFVEDFAKHHPASEDYGKTWSLSRPESSYFYNEKALGAATVDGWTLTFPHPMRGKEGSSAPDESFLRQWATSPFADTALTKLAETAVDSLGLGKSGATDYLGVSYSSTDYVGHTFGPRSWEIQDILIKLDRDLGELFAHLDQKVGRGNYLVALTADHGVAPIPVDMQQTGVDAGVLNLTELKDRLEKALESSSYPKPAIAKISGNDIYFAPGVYEKLREDSASLRIVMNAALAMPGVAAIYRGEDLAAQRKSLSQIQDACELSYMPGRSGDLIVLQKPYWLTGTYNDASKPHTGTSHGTPYYYDQRVPILLMGYGIQPGEYFGAVTPADIAPTFAALTNITLSTHNGRALSEALLKVRAK